MYIYLNKTLRKTPALGLQDTKLFELVLFITENSMTTKHSQSANPHQKVLTKKSVFFFFSIQNMTSIFQKCSHFFFGQAIPTGNSSRSVQYYWHYVIQEAKVIENGVQINIINKYIANGIF